MGNGARKKGGREAGREKGEKREERKYAEGTGTCEQGKGGRGKGNEERGKGMREGRVILSPLRPAPPSPGLQTLKLLPRTLFSV